MSVYSKPCFTTERLRVFKASIVPCPDCQHDRRDFFFACRTDVDCPMVVVSATCWPLGAQSVIGDIVYVELIETSALHRRNGLATELWHGIEKYYGKPIHGDPSTDEGEKFLVAIEGLPHEA